MKIAEIYAILDEIAPFADAENWDNSGLQIGTMQSEFDQIYVALDVDSDMILNIAPNSLLITHHPLIFGGLRSLNFAKFPANIVRNLVQKNISLISMHTNFDKHCLNHFVASKILGYEIYDEREFLVFMRVNFSFETLCKDIKSKLNLDFLRAVKAQNQIKNIALCTGSGMDLSKNLDVDCFLTGDIKYHDALSNLENGVSLIDIGHFESESYFGDCLRDFLQKKQIAVIMAHSKNPFNYY